MRRRLHAPRAGAATGGGRRRRPPGQRRARHVRSAHGGQTGADRSIGRPDAGGRAKLPLPSGSQTGGRAMSVLETPRLFFRGRITWDPIVTNNRPEQYDESDGKTVFDASAATVAAFRKDAIAAVVGGGNWN